jgi:RND family efflux transporter MFP subunit
MNARVLDAVLVCAGMVALGGGCGEPVKLPVSSPPPVTVMFPVEREVTDFEDFTGRSAAVEKLDVRARVSGYLEEIRFKEGKEVKANEILYVIDQRPFKADLEKAEGDVERSKAAVKTTQANLSRQTALMDKGATSRQDYDTAVGKALEAKGDERISLANLERARLNLDYTTIKSPIDGLISRSEITKGNLVKADDTLLTNIVSQNPMYVYFNADERTVLRVKDLILSGKWKYTDDTKIEIKLALATDVGYPRSGTLNFIDNKVDPSTGTLKLRAKVANPADSRSQLRPFSPGLFVRIHFPIGEPHKELLVPERAIGTQQGEKFLYVVDDKNEVQIRPVALGLLQDGMRVIYRSRLAPKRDKDGREVLDGEGRPVLEEVVMLSPTDKVIVNGLQRVRPGIVVEPKMAK